MTETTIETKTETVEFRSGIVLTINREYRDNRLDTIVWDYELDGRIIRVIDFHTTCGFGRANAQLIQLGTNKPTRTYKNVENAKTKAVELLLG